MADQAEEAFRRWYADMARRYDLNPNPDSSDQFYDYRAAFKANAKPDATGHWPSDFKRPGHPSMVVGGFNVQTGQRVPGTKQASEQELVQLGWDAETAKRLTRETAVTEQKPVYLNDQGEQIPQGTVYLDARGNPLSVDPYAPKPDTREWQGDRPIGPGNAFPAFVKSVRENPGSSGAMAAGAALAPFTSGLSLPAAMAMEGAAGAGGALIGHQMKGEGTRGEALKDAALQGTLGAVSTGVLGGVLRAPGALRGVLRMAGDAPVKALEMVGAVSPKARILAKMLRFGQKLGGPAEEAAAPSANAGGRLVKPPAQPAPEQAMADALAEVRAATPAPKASTLPPAPQLPAGYSPRTSAPKPKPAPKTPPAAAAKPAASELPASWRQFAQEPAPAAAASGPELGEGLSAFEREAVQRELAARGFIPKYSAEDVARYVKEYGQVIPPGTRQVRRGQHVQDALDEQRYRFHLENPASAVAVGTGGAAMFRDALLRMFGGHEQH